MSFFIDNDNNILQSAPGNNSNLTVDPQTGYVIALGTGGIQLPSGTTAQQPSVSTAVIRYNTSLGYFEGYNINASAWKQFQNHFSIVDSLGALASNGLVVNNSGTISAVSITAGSGITVVNGSGVSGAPTISITAPVTVALGGTGLTSTPTNGQLLIGNGTNYTLATLSTTTGISVTNASGSITLNNTGVTSNVAGTGISVSGATGAVTISNTGVISITGTTNQISASAATGAVTLSLPSSVTTGSLTLTSLTANSFLYSGTGGLLTTTAAPTNGQILIGSTGSAPVAATLTAGTAIGITNAAGSITVNNTGVTSAVAGTGISVSGATGAVTFTNTGVTSITGTANQVIASSSTGGVTLSLPQSIGTSSTPTFAQLTVTNSPVNATDAANKSYVDNAIQGLSFKETVSAASTANLSATYANGSSGVGATLTNSGTQAAFAIDGYTASLNDRILIKNQTTQTQNGIYTVTTLGSGSTNWVLTRSNDTNTPAELYGAYVFVDQGTINADSSWAQVTPPTITIGTSNIVWSQFSGAGTYTAGTGLTLTGTQFSLSIPVTTVLGGTGLTSIGSANQVLGVNAAGTALEYKSINGTTNQITVTQTAGNTTISLPSAVTTGSLTLTGLTANSFLYSGASGLLTTTSAPTNGQILIGSTGSAPVSAALTAGSNISITNGAGSITVAATGLQTSLQLYKENPSSPVALTASGTNSVSIGSGASTTASNAMAMGVKANAANANASALGANAVTEWVNDNVFGGPIFAAAGDTKISMSVATCQTTTNTATEIGFNTSTGAPTSYVAPAFNSTYYFEVIVTARRTDVTGTRLCEKLEFLFDMGATASTAAIVGSPLTTVIARDLGAVLWTVAVTADTTNGRPAIKVTGGTGNTIRWTASIRVLKVA